MKKLKFICTTDIHGTIHPIDFSSNQAVDYGLSRFSTYLKKERQHHDVILIDNGDVNQGSPFVTYANKNEEKNVMAKALNQLNYDYFNLGNHDFNFGSDFLMTYMDQMESQSLISNVLYEGEVIGQSQIIEVAEHGVTFGLIGVVTDYIPNWEKPAHLEGLTILPVKETVQREVAALTGKVDKIIVCYHGGLERDPESGEPTETLTGENVGYEMLMDIPEIDLLLSGHQHRSIVTTINQTLVLQAANTAREVMEVVYEDGQFSGRLVDMSNYESDEQFLSAFSDVYEKTQNWLDEKIGPGAKGLSVPDVISVQKNPNTFTHMMNQAQLAFSGADISSSSLYDTSIGFSEEITYRQLAANFPFPNTLVLMEINGEILREYLEWNADYWTISEGEITVHPKYLEPKRQIYNYDFFEGISYTINVSKESGQRIEELMFDGKAISDTDIFKIVVNNYRSSGGGDYHMLKKGRILKEYTEEIIEVMYAYLKETDLTLLTTQENNVKLTK